MADNPVIDIINTVLAKWREHEKLRAMQNRPQPPQTTGPVVGPPGELRAQVGGRYNFDDPTRRELSQTPLRYGGDQYRFTKAGGAYFPDTGETWVAKSDPEYERRTTAHEFAHKRWYDDPVMMHPEAGSMYVSDALKLANDPRFPGVNAAYKDWIAESNSDLYGHSYHPTELDARIVEYGAGEELPRQFREYWNQDIYTGPPMPEGPQQERVQGYRTPFGFVEGSSNHNRPRFDYQRLPWIMGPHGPPLSRWEILADSGFGMDE